MGRPADSTSERRVRILTDAEREALYGRPQFTAEEQMRAFTLTPAEQEVLPRLRTVSSQLIFILQLGYFRTTHLLSTFTLAEVAEDVAYVRARYFPATPLADLHDVNKRTLLHHDRLIAALFGYRRCRTQERQLLAARAAQAAQISSKPIYVFRDLTQYLSDQRIIAPGYTILQTIIGQALTDEQQRLTVLVSTLLSATDVTSLDELCVATSDLYPLTRLKQAPKDFSLGELRQEIARADQLRPLYALAQRVLPQLGVSNETITYLAALVSYYSMYRLQQLAAPTIHLYLLCFVFHRYQRTQDTLLMGIIHHVRRFGEAAKEAAVARILAYRLESNQNVAKAGQILKLFTTDQPDGTPFADVQAKAFALLPRDQLERTADYISTTASFDATAFEWDHLDTLAHQFKRHIRPLLSAVALAASPAHAELLQAITLLKTTFKQNQALTQVPVERFPTHFIPKAVRRYLFAPAVPGPADLLHSRYEFLVYRLIRQGLDAGEIFCRDSVQFRSFEDDLVDDARWQAKASLLADSGAPRLLEPIETHLAALQTELETRLATVNARITAGENSSFRRTSRSRTNRWTLEYPTRTEAVNHSLFATLAPVDIGSVLQFVDQHCQFMQCFTPLLGRYSKQSVDEQVLRACIVAWGTNMGLGRMGSISDLTYGVLARASDQVLRLETLRAANDRISNATAAIPGFHAYDLGGTIHSSSDGQKFETSRPTLNARDSPKYFGLKKGVVAYTLVANHIPVQARIIGAHDHESHYVFDVLFNNTTDIQPTVHSTDTHGTNQVNFALLHLFGYQFAPRYQDLPDRVRTGLYGFHHPSHYGDVPLKPIRKLNTDLIVSEWDNLQRIFVSLALKTTTQSIIVRKLSSYARRNRTRRALWEYDNIHRSLYFLSFIDSPPLRQQVQHALNRGENYHQLRRAVSYANFGKLRFTTEADQELWSECSRLITNCVIFYNAMILAEVRAQHLQRGDLAAMAELDQVSPVAWQHINFYGRYAFTTHPTPIYLAAIVAELAGRSTAKPVPSH